MRRFTPVENDRGCKKNPLWNEWFLLIETPQCSAFSTFMERFQIYKTNLYFIRLFCLNAKSRRIQGSAKIVPVPCISIISTVSVFKIDDTGTKFVLYQSSILKRYKILDRSIFRKWYGTKFCTGSVQADPVQFGSVQSRSENYVRISISLNKR